MSATTVVVRYMGPHDWTVDLDGATLRAPSRRRALALAPTGSEVEVHEPPIAEAGDLVDRLTGATGVIGTMLERRDDLDTVVVNLSDRVVWLMDLLIPELDARRADDAAAEEPAGDNEVAGRRRGRGRG